MKWENIICNNIVKISLLRRNMKTIMWVNKSEHLYKARNTVKRCYHLQLSLNKFQANFKNYL